MTNTPAQRQVARRILSRVRRGDRIWYRTPQGITREARVIVRQPAQLIARTPDGARITATEENLV